MQVRHQVRQSRLALFGSSPVVLDELEHQQFRLGVQHPRQRQRRVLGEVVQHVPLDVERGRARRRATRRAARLVLDGDRGVLLELGLEHLGHAPAVQRGQRGRSLAEGVLDQVTQRLFDRGRHRPIMIDPVCGCKCSSKRRAGFWTPSLSEAKARMAFFASWRFVAGLRRGNGVLWTLRRPELAAGLGQLADLGLDLPQLHAR
ncbi:MAG: hypothetical protein ACI89L_000764 [Phycisphaerales bacterium]